MQLNGEPLEHVRKINRLERLSDAAQANLKSYQGGLQEAYAIKRLGYYIGATMLACLAPHVIACFLPDIHSLFWNSIVAIAGGGMLGRAGWLKKRSEKRAFGYNKVDMLRAIQQRKYELLGLVPSDNATSESESSNEQK